MALTPALQFGMGSVGGSGIDVPNSGAFSREESDYLSRTFGTPTSSTKWTLSFFIKRANPLIDHQTIMSYQLDGGTYTRILWYSTGQLTFDSYVTSTNNITEVSPNLFRDVADFYHIVITYDSDNATAGDRYIVRVNNNRVSNPATMVGLGETTHMNSAVLHNFGRAATSGTYTSGNLAEVHFIDGQALTSTDFALFDSNNQWVAKEYTGTYGNNGFYLNFQNGASLGEDSSGNSNDWTNSGVTQSTDTPTNNYPILNSLEYTAGVISNAGLTIVTPSSLYGSTRATLFPASGMKVYAEFLAAAGGAYYVIGVSPTTTDFEALATTKEEGFGYYAGNGRLYGNGTTIIQTGGASYATNDIISVTIDVDGAESVWRKNDVIIYTQALDTSKHYAWSVSDFAGVAGVTITARFTEDSWTYSPPSGFTALSTATMPEPAVLPSTNGFVLEIDTEANIASTVATARTGWVDYVDLLKNRDSAEDWAWQFSHDSSNEFATGTTAAYQSKRTLAGSDNWVGYSIRIGSTYGTAAGSQAHTNGADTTVTHNLGSTVAAIWLFPRNGGDIIFHHPELTAGKLLTWNTADAEATSSLITDIGSNSFDIGASAATGTYDYLVVSEIEGFSSLSFYKGNFDADGAINYMQGRPDFNILKRKTAFNSWNLYDSARTPSNVIGGVLYPNLNNIETTGVDADFLSNGLKLRRAANGTNADGNDFITVSFLSPSKYTRAR